MRNVHKSTSGSTMEADSQSGGNLVPRNEVTFHFTALRLHLAATSSGFGGFELEKYGKLIKKSSIHGRLPEWMYHQYSSVSSINIGKSSNRPWIIIDWSISFQARLLVRLLKRPFCATPWPFPPLAADSPTSRRPDRWRPHCWSAGFIKHRWGFPWPWGSPSDGWFISWKIPSKIRMIIDDLKMMIDPLVNVYITMEHHHFLWVNQL